MDGLDGMVLMVWVALPRGDCLSAQQGRRRAKLPHNNRPRGATGLPRSGLLVGKRCCSRRSGGGEGMREGGDWG